MLTDPRLAQVAARTSRARPTAISCGVFIAAKLGVSQPTASEHLRVLSHAGLVRAKRIKQWTFYKRDEKRIAEVKRAFRSAW